MDANDYAGNLTVGASLLAMNLNDNAGNLTPRVIVNLHREHARSYTKAGRFHQ